MASPIPPTMRSLCTRKFGPPSNYEIASLPTPKITKSNEVLIKVHAASINPTDIGGANGAYWPIFSVPLPFKIGYDLSGTIAAVGTGVTEWKVGDEIFCSLPFKDGERFGMGSASEYALAPQEFIVSKPKNLTFVEAASAPMVAMTAIQMIARVPGNLKDRSVFVPGGLSGVGSMAVQLAKNVYGASKVVTSVSTAKVPMIDNLLGKGVADEVIDYTKLDITKAIPAHSIDVMLDVIGTSFSSLPLIRPSGTIVSCAGYPTSGSNVQKISASAPSFIVLILNLLNSFLYWRAGRWGVKYDSVLMVSNLGDMEKVKQWLEEGKIRPVVGKVVKLGNIEGIREECTRMAGKRGGVGKLVIEVISE